MYTQRNPELHEHIQSDGCALMSIVAAASVYHPESFIRPQAVNSVYQRALGDGSMRERSLIWDWQAVFQHLGMDVEYYGHMDRDWQPGPGEFAIVKWVLSIPHEGINWTHFTLGPGETHPFYDPWGATSGHRTSRTVAEGVMESKRGFRVL